MATGSRKRTITNEEIGLVKAMLAKGMKNDEVHFYFNRADRLISSGRITQIKQGKYGSEAIIATPAELEIFFSTWKAQQFLDSAKRNISAIDHEAITALFMKTNNSWVLRLGETDKAECKHSFRLEPLERFADSIRTIAGFANNKGGYILFGVNDGTQTVEGLSNDLFSNTDPAAINRALAATLDPIPHVTKTSVIIDNKLIGVLYVEPHNNAPVMAVKNIGNSTVKEGAIYYRYVGETRQIKPGELRQIIANREQRAVAEFSQRMTRLASGTEATINLDTGQVVGKSGSFIIDQNLLPSLQFIREGEFSEVKGAPALRLIGDVKPVGTTGTGRARIIRENVTPDSVIRNFLRDVPVSDPMQYIHAQAHCQRKWLPVWYYVEQTGMPVEKIIEDLKAQITAHPSIRDAVVQRLRQPGAAFKFNPGKPAIVCAALARGETVEPKGDVEDLRLANAIMGLTKPIPDSKQVKRMLLGCLNRAQGQDQSSGNRRSAIYRAACRLDELLHNNA
ncbi:AlbA family DNA-binding domain-containing protein [Microvirga sp. P5_D2]